MLLSEVAPSYPVLRVVWSEYDVGCDEIGVGFRLVMYLGSFQHKLGHI